jgi:ketosteroid isomerase-like protein
MIFPSSKEMRRIALDEYFGLIERGTIAETLERFFAPDASFTMFPSGRIFTGYDEIAGMYRSVFDRHPVIVREVLDVVADADSGILSASFRATVPREDSEPIVMHNVNFWQFAGEKFAWVKVFSSDSAL